VVGYSSFDTVPPPNSLFGRVGGGLSPFNPVPQGPRWGLHVYDVNIALGNLVGLVRDQAAAFTRPARLAAASRRR
jgi:hypothetical protein